MDVANARDGMHRTPRAENDPALIDQRLIKPAAKHLHGEEAVRSNATHHAAKLVHMRVHHDARAGSS